MTSKSILSGIASTLLSLLILSVTIVSCDRNIIIPPEKEEKENPREKIIGAWELVTLNDKSLKAGLAQEFEDDITEVQGVEAQLTFGADGTLSMEIFFEMEFSTKAEQPIGPVGGDPEDIDFEVNMTVNFISKITIDGGNYTISGNTLILTYGEDAEADSEFSIIDLDIPELAELFDPELKQQFIDELEQEFVDPILTEYEQGLIEDLSPEPEPEIYRFILDGNSLTLIGEDGDQEIFRRK